MAVIEAAGIGAGEAASMYEWITACKLLSDEEKEAVLRDNPDRLIGAGDKT
jgi:hypothetical protein